MSRIFGPVRQTAYLVQDIERAMQEWMSVLGVGPFFYLKNHAAQGATFRGKPTDMRISLAFAQSGPIQIELVQQLNDGPSLFRESLDAGHGYGLHHLAFWTEQFDCDMARYLGAEYEAVQTAGLGGPNNRNAFIERSGPVHSGPAIEISEISGAKGEFFREIAAAAEAWDGVATVRQVGGGIR